MVFGLTRSGRAASSEDQFLNKKRKSRRKLFKSFIRNDDGAYAIEFAIVSIPFFILFIGLFEIALLFFATQLLDAGVANAARLVRTGQAQDLSEAEFKEKICDSIGALFTCPGGIYTDVRVYDSFSDTNPADLEKDEDGNIDVTKLPTGYTPGSAGDIIVVKVSYEWPIILPSLGAALNGTSDGNALISSTTAFRNEPF